MKHSASILLLCWLALNVHGYAFNRYGDLILKPAAPIHDQTPPNQQCLGIICHHPLQLNTGNCQCECQDVEILHTISVLTQPKTKSSSGASLSTEPKTETHMTERSRTTLCATGQHGCTQEHLKKRNADEQPMIHYRAKRYWPSWQPSWHQPNWRPASTRRTRRPSTRRTRRPSTRRTRRPSTRPASTRRSRRPSTRRTRRPSTRPASTRRSRRPSTRPASTRRSYRRGKRDIEKDDKKQLVLNQIKKWHNDNGVDTDEQPMIHNRFKRRHRGRGRRPSTRRPSTRRPSTRRPSTRRPSTRRPSTRRPSTRRPSTRRPSTRRPSMRRPSTRPASTRRSRRPSYRRGKRDIEMILNRMNKWQSIGGQAGKTQPMQGTITVSVTIPGNTCPAGQRLSQPNSSCKCY